MLNLKTTLAVISTTAFLGACATAAPTQSAGLELDAMQKSRVCIQVTDSSCPTSRTDQRMDTMRSDVRMTSQNAGARDARSTS